MKKIKTSALIGLGALGILFGRKMPGVQVIADEDRIARYSAEPVVCNGEECKFSYASYATVDFLQQMADSQQLRVHIRESGSMEALDHVLRRGYHLALLRYAEEDEDYYRRYCDRHGLHREQVLSLIHI